MNKVIDSNACSQKIVGKEVGTVSVSMYKDLDTGLPFFYVKSDNTDVLQLSYIIEDSLFYY